MRSEPVEFDAVLELMPWGRNVYTVIKVPDRLAEQAAGESTRRVAGTVDDLPVNMGLNRADVIAESFLYVGKGWQQRLGARAGDVVRCVLAPADPDEVLVPDDVLAALEKDGLRDAFEQKPATERRRLLAPVDGASRPATRARRVAVLLDSLVNPLHEG